MPALGSRGLARPRVHHSLLAVLGVTSLLTLSGCGGNDSPPTKGTSLASGGGAGADGDTPDDVAGSYMVTLTNGENDCTTMNDGWMVGAVTNDVPFLITQHGTSLEAEAMGATALGLALLTANYQFTGEVHGSHFKLTDQGTKPNTYGDCTYTIDVIVEGDLSGDDIAGP